MKLNTALAAAWTTSISEHPDLKHLVATVDPVDPWQGIQIEIDILTVIHDRIMSSLHSSRVNFSNDTVVSLADILDFVQQMATLTNTIKLVNKHKKIKELATAFLENNKYHKNPSVQAAVKICNKRDCDTFKLIY